MGLANAIKGLAAKGMPLVKKAVEEGADMLSNVKSVEDLADVASKTEFLNLEKMMNDGTVLSYKIPKHLYKPNANASELKPYLVDVYNPAVKAEPSTNSAPVKQTQASTGWKKP